MNFQFCEICGYKKSLTTNLFSPLSFFAIFGSGIRDPGSGMGKNQDPGSGINIPDPQHWDPDSDPEHCFLTVYSASLPDSGARSGDADCVAGPLRGHSRLHERRHLQIWPAHAGHPRQAVSKNSLKSYECGWQQCFGSASWCRSRSGFGLASKPVLRIRNRDPGWTSQIIFTRAYKHFFCVKNTLILYADPDPRFGIMSTLDPGWEKSV